MVTAIERRASIFMADIRINAKLYAWWRKSSAIEVSNNINVILPKDSQWSCQRASDQRAFNHIVHKVPFFEASTREPFQEEKKARPVRAVGGEKAGRRQNVSQQVQSKSEWNASVLQFYFIITSHVLDWYRYTYIWIYIQCASERNR